MAAVDIYVNETTRPADVILPPTTISDLRRHPEGVHLGPLRPTLPDRLRTPTKRIDLAQEMILADLDRVRTELLSAEGPSEGLLLIGRRHQRDNNSWMHNVERLTRGRPRRQLLMHPDDLAERGITEAPGSESPRGSGRSRWRSPRPTT